jgi:RNA polymerase sigma factor (sigma-70 family)
LVDAVTRDVEGSWEELVERFGGMVWSVALGHGLCQSDAKDVTQAVWLNLFNNIGSLRDPARVAGWLRTTARNESLGVLRRRGRAQPVDLHSSLRERPGADPGPAEQVLSTYGDPTLRGALSELTDACRRLLLMLAADPPASYSEVAQAVNVSLGTIGSKRRRCLDHLRELYETRAAAEMEAELT